MADESEYTPRPRTAFERVMEPFVASRPGSWLWVNIIPHVDRALMRVSGGRLNTSTSRVGMLRVRGAKTGALRETPLVYARDGERVIVVASRGGDSKHPAWYRNVVANPDVTFEIRGDERPYRARTLEGPERERSWKLACDRYAGYLVYARRAGEREIPVVALEPSETGSPEATPTGTST